MTNEQKAKIISSELMKFPILNQDQMEALILMMLNEMEKKENESSK